jgi:hypothetical protein
MKEARRGEEKSRERFVRAFNKTYKKRENLRQ